MDHMEMARRRQLQKQRRRFDAYLEGLFKYHPLHAAQGVLPDWWFRLAVDPADDDGPPCECYCQASGKPPCGCYAP